MRRVLLLGLCALICGRAADAQSRKEPRTHRAIPDLSNVAPKYPEMLRAAGVEGSVRARFVVDSAGQPVRGMFKIVRSDNDLLSNAFRLAIATWRFTPARLRGRHIADTVELEVAFTLPAERTLWLVDAELLEFEAVGPGQWRMVVGGPKVMPTPLPVDSATERDVTMAVFDQLLKGIARADAVWPSRIACIGITKGKAQFDPDLAMLKRLDRPNIAVVALRRCPPTFGSMFQRERPDPPGEDPFAVNMLSVRSWSPDIVFAKASVGHATGGEEFACRVMRDQDGQHAWRAACSIERSWVH